MARKINGWILALGCIGFFVWSFGYEIVRREQAIDQFLERVLAPADFADPRFAEHGNLVMSMQYKIGAWCWLVGTLLLVPTLAYLACVKGHRWGWGLWGLCGWLGVIAVLMLEDKSTNTAMQSSIGIENKELEFSRLRYCTQCGAELDQKHQTRLKHEIEKGNSL